MLLSSIVFAFDFGVSCVGLFCICQKCLRVSQHKMVEAPVFARLGVDLSGLLSKLLLPFPPFFRVIAAAPQPIVSDVRR